jgi:two-component system alkaline phosphatase synthesis response regulator PhoP
MSKIMVVEDDRKARFVIGELLEKEGYEVIEADSGKRCLEILKNEKPDLILMDVMMTEMDGWDVVKEIKKDRSNDGIVISMLTVKSQEGDKVKSLSEADWHISKPVRKEKLLKTVDWLLSSR